ncbi:MAG TPA: sigma-70 family RNA polymerase sigma factor [Galbitalea sp.]
MTGVPAAIAAVHRSDWSRIVSGLIRVTGDWALAEDAAQDAFAIAVARWPREGIPEKPAAWLAVTARNRAIDRLRSATSERSKLREVAIMDSLTRQPDASIEDDRLRLIFTCCHPALPLAARVALTLRTVAGLTVPEIAAAFLVPETTMAQRLVRARAKIANAGIPYRVPPPELLGERLSGVLAVLYLVFNEGYTAGARADLADSAIALASSVVDLMPTEPEAGGLLALMLFQDSRRAARISNDGRLLTLAEQDRGLWNSVEIARAGAVLDRAMSRGRGAYVVQAAIAEVHAGARTAEATNWQRIVPLYDELLELSPTPVIELNRAIAVGMRDGPDAGLALIDELAGSLDGFRLVPAARADLLERAGRREDAAASYREALALTSGELEREQLAARLADLEV